MEEKERGIIIKKVIDATKGELGYLNLVESIIEYGTFKEPARSNMPRTKSLFGNMLKFDLRKGFPLFTTKKMFTKGMVAELLWFMSGNTNVRKLAEQGVTKFWHQDAYNFYKKHLMQNTVNWLLPYEEWCEALMRNNSLGTCGKIYGYQWRRFNGKHDQLLEVIRDIICNPYGRYKVITAWNPCDIQDQALPACHMLVQFNCRPMEFGERLEWLYEYMPEQYDILKDTPVKHMHAVNKNMNALGVPKMWLDASMTQRSADMMLGVPINIASYSLLLSIIAYMTNCQPGWFTWFGNDCHVYEHHIETARVQITREPYEPCKLSLDKVCCRQLNAVDINEFSSSDLDTIIDSMEIDDFKFENYKHHDALQFELFTGMTKPSEI